LEEQNKVPVFEISREVDFPLIKKHDLIIDALFDLACQATGGTFCIPGESYQCVSLPGNCY